MAKNDMTSIKIRRYLTIFFTIFYIMVVFVWGAFCLTMIRVLPSERAENEYYCEEYEDGWLQVKADGSKQLISFPAHLEPDDGETTTIEVKLPADIKDDAYLVFRVAREDAKVYIDGELRSEYSAKRTYFMNQTSPARYQFTSINRDDENKTATIVLKGKGKYAGLIYEPYIANFSGFWSQVIKKEFVTVGVAALMLMLGVSGTIVGFIFWIVYRRQIRLMAISTAVVMVASWILANSMLRQLLFDNISVISEVPFITLMFMPIPFYAYLNDIQDKRYTAWYGILMAYSSVNIVAISTLEILGIKQFTDTYVLNASSILLLSLTALVTIIIDIFKNRIRSYWLSAISLLVIASIAVFEVIEYLMLSFAFSVNGIALIFIFLLIIATVDSITGLVNERDIKEQALSSNEMRSKFFEGVGHEIRTPINAILAYNEMILRESDDKTVLEYASDVDVACHSLIAIANDMIDAAALGNERIEPVSIEFSLRELLDTILVVVHFKAKEKNLDLKVEVDPNIPDLLCGDPKIYSQILSNLLLNAIQYTDRGSVTLRVEAEKLEDDVLNFSFAVKDTGRGIPQKQLMSIFDMNVAREIAEKNGKKTGFGLPLSMLFAMLINGTITAESKEGSGSVFVFKAPIKTIGTDKIGQFYILDRRAKLSKKELPFTLQNTRILVVDDVPMNINVFCSVLKNSGIVIDTASNGAEALELWKTQHYDMAFIDESMPGMSGKSACKVMKLNREMNPKAALVVVAMTNVGDIFEDEYRSAGFDDYLEKPFESEAVFQLIEKYIAKDKIVR